ncbi:MAG: carbon-nitrogen hydrolase family protein, partial [Planctomycetota bacterium]
PSCFIQPDGRIVGQLEDHKEGLMINSVDLNEKFYDPTAPFRNMAIDGTLTNRTDLIEDIRSKKRDLL